MGGMTIATWTNEDLTEKEDEHVCVCPRRPQGGVKNERIGPTLLLNRALKP